MEWLGEIAALSAALVWAVASLIFSQLGRGEAKVAPRTLNVFKCTLALVLMGVVVGSQHGALWPEAASAEQIAALGLSGVIGLTLGDTAYFHALIRLGPRRTLLCATLGTPATALMAWPLLGEPLSGEMALGIAVTLGGVAWVIRERTPPPEGAPQRSQGELRGELLAGLGFALVAVTCQAAGNVLTKFGGAVISAAEATTLRLLFGAAALWIWVAVKGELGAVREVAREPRRLGWLVAASLLGTFLGIWLLVTGLKYTEKAGVAATLSSMSPVFILPLSAIYLKERLSARAVLGVLVALAGVAILTGLAG